MNHITFSRKNVIAHSLIDPIFNNKNTRLLSEKELDQNETEFLYFSVFHSVRLCFRTEQEDITCFRYNCF